MKEKLPKELKRQLLLAVENVRNQFANEFGERIRLRRKELELTQEDLGELVGVKWNTISQWERGHGVLVMKFSNLLRLCSALDIDIRELVWGKS